MVKKLKENKDIDYYFTLYDSKIKEEDIFYQNNYSDDINLSHVNELNKCIDKICANSISNTQILGCSIDILPYNESYYDDLLIKLSGTYLLQTGVAKSISIDDDSFSVKLPSFYNKINIILQTLGVFKSKHNNLEIFKILRVIEKIVKDDDNFLKCKIIKMLCYKMNNQTKYSEYKKDKEGFISSQKDEQSGLFNEYYKNMKFIAELDSALTINELNCLDVKRLNDFQKKITMKSSITDLFAIIFYIHKDNSMFSNFNKTHVLIPHIKQNAPQIDVNKVFKYAKPTPKSKRYCFLTKKFV